MAEFILRKNGGEDNVTIVGNIGRLIRSLSSEHTWKVTVKQDKSTRSDRQNKYYWSAVLPTIRDYWDESMGELHKNEVWHEYFKDRYIQPEVVTVRGFEVKLFKSSTKLNTLEFCEYIERIALEVAEFGCVVPEPTDKSLLDHQKRYTRS